MKEHKVWTCQADETIDELIMGGQKLIQAREGYRFSLDAVLLSHFVNLDGINNAVDLGTGNGVIPILLAFRSLSLRVTGIEIQEKMVDRARRNVQYNNLEQRIEIMQGDLRTIENYMTRGFAELVLSNPPFYKKGEGMLNRNQEEAIARHEIEVELPELLAAASYILAASGRLAIIHRAERLLEITELMANSKLTPCRLRLIHPFADRTANLLLLEAKKNGKGKLTILPPLIIYQKPGIYSDEIKEIYSDKIG
ncbi:MAG: tRNA1(Val) (adenine(37)-N6)-methyltransferase [Syntrophomonadaceae bacterium]|nr:tRNA1(Val) (adenine(37)-N6)-methyltransferase [Syntrophomonadaceae bacterium]MDD3023201.1 tRNA1(Val) (adenine(37)-N6)-methyltransferase [Syntrophomonadaceae bacterium]